MISPQGRPAVALIAGPTASGKSAHALALAERTGGVIVNADSAQVYRDLRILSARPSAEEEARVPHRLFGYVDGADACSAAQWAGDARAAIAAAHAEGRLPILVGGTGMYIRTLLDGIAPVPEIDPEVRATVRALDVAAARAALEREDAEAAARIGPRDTARIARALEVVRSTGQSILIWRARRSGGIADGITLQPLVILPPTELLYARCDARAAAMIAAGALDEAAALKARRLDHALPVMRAIGVPPLLRHLNGEITLDAALRQLQQDTRNYAKRQKTWIRHQFPEAWPHVPFVDSNEVHPLRAV
ncbi:tRNA (adenosine(37)-N6)-dimethylallyltransferase MiaA [Sphingomonas quercus]